MHISKSMIRLEKVFESLSNLQFEEQLFGESITKNSLRFLTEQAVEDQKATILINDINDAVDLSNQEIDDFMGALPSNKFPTLRDAMAKAKAELADVRLGDEASLEYLFGDEGMTKVARVVGNVANLLGSVASGTESALGALKDLGAEMDDEDKGAPIKSLIDKYTSGVDAVPGVPTKDDFKRKIGKQIKTPQSAFGKWATKAKGFFGKIFGGGGRDVGFGLSQDEFVDELLDLSANEFDALMKRGQEEIEDATTAGTNDPMAQLAADLEKSDVDMGAALSGAGPEKSIGDEKKDEKGQDEPGLSQEEVEQADEEAEKRAEQVGGGPISKMELTALLKKYPELTGKGDKATYQRRVFRKTINKIAGKEVFEENYEYTGKQLQVISEALVNLDETDKDNSLLGQYETWTDDEMTRYNWMKMAGLE